VSFAAKHLVFSDAGLHFLCAPVFLRFLFFFVFQKNNPAVAWRFREKSVTLAARMVERQNIKNKNKE